MTGATGGWLLVSFLLRRGAGDRRPDEGFAITNGAAARRTEDADRA